MRRLIFSITAATLCGLAASAQEASSASENGIEVSAIARFDVNPYFPVKRGSETDFSFGNTSVYTFIDGTFGRGWSYSISNHWLGVDWYKNLPDDKLSPLYSNTWHSDETNWIDWATIGYELATENAGTWSFTLGKDMMTIGLTELDDYDVDCHFDLSSFFWNGSPLETDNGTWFDNGMQVYQWGGSVAWLSSSESTGFKFQMSSSPYSVRPYQDFKKAFAFQWDESAGCWNGRLSVNAVEGYKGYDADDNPYGTSWWRYLAIGETFDLGDLSIYVDAMMRGTTWENPFQETLATARVQYDFGEKLSLFAKGGWEMFGYDKNSSVKPFHTGFGGIGAHWYPLRDSQALRIHAVVAANNVYNQLSVNLGVTYNLCLSDFWNK